MVITEPPSFNRFPACCKKKYAALALMSNIESYSASLVSTMGLRNTLPTALIAMSTPPKAFTAASNNAVTLAGLVRSPCTLIALTPAACTVATVLSASGSEAALL